MLPWPLPFVKRTWRIQKFSVVYCNSYSLHPNISALEFPLLWMYSIVFLIYFFRSLGVVLCQTNFLLSEVNLVCAPGANFDTHSESRSQCVCAPPEAMLGISHPSVASMHLRLSVDLFFVLFPPSGKVHEPWYLCCIGRLWSSQGFPTSFWLRTGGSC